MSDILPVELWCLILTYLPVHDRLVCCLVCKNFLAAYQSLSKSIKNETILTFTSEVFNEKSLDTFKRPTRSFTNLTVSGLPDGSLSSISACQEFSSEIVSLTLINWVPSPFDLYNFVKATNQLESLSIVSPDFESLDWTLIGQRFYNQKEADEMKSSFSYLKRIKLKLSVPLNGAVEKYFSDLILMMPPLSCIEWEVECHNMFTTQILPDLIQKSKDRLKALTIKDCRLSETFWEMLSQLDLKLFKLNLDTCIPGDGPYLIPFLKNLKDLRCLNLGNRTDIFAVKNVLEVVEIFRNMKKVNCLSLEGVSMRKFDSCFGHMKLEYLNVSSSDILSSEILEALTKGNFKLRHLNMDKFYIPKDKFINIISYIPTLVELDLSFCNEEIDNVVVLEISQNLIKLQVLILTKCKKITDEGFLGKSEKPKGVCSLNLYELHASGCRITDLSCKEGFNFSRLRICDLTECPGITDSGLIEVVQKNPTLQVFKFNDTLSSSDEIIKIISPLFRLRLVELHHGLSGVICEERALALKAALQKSRSKKKFLYIFKRELRDKAVL